MKIAFPTDEHYPFQDEWAIEVALQIVQDFDPDIRVAGSDGIDFYSISKFQKNPKRLLSLQDDIDQWITGQQAWNDAAPNAAAYFLRGNHEDRLRKYLWDHPEISSLRSLQIHELLALDELGVRWRETQEDNELEIFERLVIRHGDTVRKHSAYSARAELESEFYARTVLTGHTHRAGAHFATTRNGVVTAYECFCLCDLNPHYLRSTNWQQGIVLAEISENAIEISQIPFYRRYSKPYALWRGKEYS